ncbi:RNA helicase Mov10l1-like [Protopterus annectens]|uniref:RNA helicase Mov10l1-like n=1 Tax=Protopterus annectens TaxID=7888 RepID=UPI001CF9B54F|nr:RNA helicase Mov10l1-like [Protopterus annectens]
MLALLSKIGSFLWRRADDEQHDENDNKENTEISIQNGVVTRFCDDYGMVNDLVCFTNAVVVAHIPLFVGQKVNVIAQKDKTSGGWSAIRVEPVCDKWEEDGNRISASGLPDLDNPKSLVGSITSCNEDGGCINQTVYFSMENVCEGFQPYRGDWVQADYYVNPAKWTSFACFVKPLRYKRFDKVTVSSVHGRNGVIDDAIFFTLDSLRLRENYLPRRNDVVNVVGVESSQSCYSWRALCMAPAFRNGLSSTTTFEKDETIENLLTRNKGGLQVSRLTDFGTIVQGESKNILIWIENKGDEAHSLISCKLARWDKENQFRIELHIEGNRAEPNDVTAARSTSVSVHNPISETSAHAGQYSPFNLLLHVPVKTRMLQLPLHSPGTTSDAPGDKMNRMNVLNREAEQVFHIADGAKNSSLKGSNVTLNGDVAEGKNVEATEHVLVIAPGEKTSIIVWCIAKNPGRCRELLLLCFSDFVIGRYIAVNVVAKEECHVGPAEPYRPKSFSFKQETTGRKVLIPAPSSTRLIRRQLPNFLPQYPIPKALRDSVEKQSDILVIQPCLAESLNMENYKKRFSTLLWLEDVQVENELNDFSMSAVILKKNGDLLVLEVPGISECRPSLYIGDRVILKSSEYSEKVVEYTSYVVEIHEEEVSLRVDLAFQKTYNGEPMDVEFLFNRTTSRRCQFAVEQALHLGERVLFPESIDIQKPQILALWDGEETFHEELNKKQKNKKTKEGQSKAVEDEDDKSAAVSISDVISVGTQVGTAKADGLGMKKECGFPFFNPILNEHQRMAVKRILSAECRPIPYILFGPPGTGKTITIIETILQIHFTLADSRILACTPSNSAADLLCVRLHETSLLRPGSMVRVNATTRMEESMDEIVKSYSKDGEDIWQASRFRIIICTCSSAGMFYQIGVSNFSSVYCLNKRSDYFAVNSPTCAQRQTEIDKSAKGYKELKDSEHKGADTVANSPTEGRGHAYNTRASTSKEIRMTNVIAGNNPPEQTITVSRRPATDFNCTPKAGISYNKSVSNTKNVELYVKGNIAEVCTINNHINYAETFTVEKEHDNNMLLDNRRTEISMPLATSNTGETASRTAGNRVLRKVSERSCFIFPDTTSTPAADYSDVNKCYDAMNCLLSMNKCMPKDYSIEMHNANYLGEKDTRTSPRERQDNSNSASADPLHSCAYKKHNTIVPTACNPKPEHETRSEMPTNQTSDTITDAPNKTRASSAAEPKGTLHYNTSSEKRETTTRYQNREAQGSNASERSSSQNQNNWHSVPPKASGNTQEPSGRPQTYRSNSSDEGLDVTPALHENSYDGTGTADNSWWSSTDSSAIRSESEGHHHQPPESYLANENPSVSRRCNELSAHNQQGADAPLLDGTGYITEMHPRLPPALASTPASTNSSSNTEESEIVPTVLKRKSTFNPSLHNNLNVFSKICENEFRAILNHKPKRTRSNLSYEEKKALQSLRTNKELTVMKADKGAGIVIMDTTKYNYKMEQILKDPEKYKIVSKTEVLSNFKKIDKVLARLAQQNDIGEEELDFMSVDSPDVGKLFGIPKIHKDPDDPPLRHIVSSKKTKTEFISQLLDHEFNPYAQTAEFYLKDSWEFLNRIHIFQNSLPPPRKK